MSVSDYDPTDIRGQERAKEGEKLRARMASEVEEKDLKWLMSSNRGRRILWRLLEHSGVFRLSFNVNAMTMAFNEGGRNYGNRTMGLIHAYCPELYHTMVKENNDGNA